MGSFEDGFDLLVSCGNYKKIEKSHEWKSGQIHWHRCSFTRVSRVFDPQRVKFAWNVTFLNGVKGGGIRGCGLSATRGLSHGVVVAYHILSWAHWPGPCRVFLVVSSLAVRVLKYGTYCCARFIGPKFWVDSFHILVQIITITFVHNDLWSWFISSRSFRCDFAKKMLKYGTFCRVRSTTHTMLDGFFLFLGGCILWMGLF